MDVRCEKCQTEYELDEARLKPGGVTVKCTNCGHMFKIRRRPTTNVGTPAEPRPRTQSQSQSTKTRADSIAGEAADETVDRQWLIRLENGDQKSCRELATLQQWIVACVVTRESLISRTGKTWKRIGDISELAQYFEIADEARESRAKPLVRDETSRGTMLGVGSVATASGGTIIPDDEAVDHRTTGSFPTVQPARRPTTTPPPRPGNVVSKTPPMGSNSVQTPPPPPRKATPTPPPPSPSLPARRPLTTPPPPPKKSSQSGPMPIADGRGAPPLPAGNRATATWATDGADRVRGASVAPQPSGPSGPFVGKLSAIPDEPAFAGKVRVAPPDDASFDTGNVGAFDDDDDLLPKRRSSSGVLILLMVLFIGTAAAAAVYFFVIKKSSKPQLATGPADAMVVAQVPDAAPIVTPVIDAPESPTSVIEHALGELRSDNEVRLKVAIEQQSDPPPRSVRALYGVALAQALVDRAGFAIDKADADKLRKESKTLVIEAATAAQKAFKDAADDPAANLALAHVLRLQAKPAHDVKRYVDAARAKAGDWTREADLADALLLARDGKLDDAKTAFAAIDSGPGKLETSSDVRARFHLALIALAQNRVADAKPLVEQVLAAQPEHVGARALVARLDVVVARTDPLPPEDPKPGPGSSGPGPLPFGGGDYDTLVRKGNAVADSNCTTASEYYTKALDKKPNGVEALTGLGYCQLAAKNYSSAHSKFRTALVISPRFEPALAGIAEAYQQQGRKDDAITSWRRYLEAYPGSKRALAALERLGVKDEPPSGSNSGSGSSSGSGSDTPPPPPPPATPADGSGSG